MYHTTRYCLHWRDSGSLVPQDPAVRLAGRRWTVQAVAVLAGLFRVHGVASPAEGRCGGIPVTALTGTPVMPAAALVHRVPRPPGRPGLPLPLFLGVSRT
jgi:hypothetical protein